MDNEIGNTSNYTERDIYLTDLELSVRARNCLEKAGFTTLQQVASLTHDELYSIQHLGAKTANEIESVIEQHRSGSDGTSLADQAVGGDTPYSRVIDVPSLVRPTLQRLEVRTLCELAALDINQLSERLSGLGQKKQDAITQAVSEARKILGLQSKPASHFGVNPEFEEQGQLIVGMRWRDIPLSVPPKSKAILDAANIETIGELVEFLNEDRKKVSPKVSVELRRLFEAGLDGYRFGEVGKPQSISQLLSHIEDQVGQRNFQVLRARCEDRTLGDISESMKLTRERVRQLHVQAVAKCFHARDAAKELIYPARELLISKIFENIATVASVTGADAGWKIRMAFDIAGVSLFVEPDGRASVFNAGDIQVFGETLMDLIEGPEYQSCEMGLPLTKLLESLAATDAGLASRIESVFSSKEILLSPLTIRSIIGDDLLRRNIRSQLVAAGTSGVKFSDISAHVLFDSPEHLADLMGDEAERRSSDTFRRPGKVYRQADEIIEILSESGEPLSINEIMNRSQYDWNQGSLVGRYLTPLKEIICIESGVYSHISLYDLSIDEIEHISTWGAELLEGERKAVDGRILFELYTEAFQDHKIVNAMALTSVIAKHPDVRRLSNNLALAHRESIEEESLFLATTNPEVAVQWHPEKNGDATPENVRPASSKIYWWQCQEGHEFQASPAARTRAGMNCPGCGQRWTVAKLRLFIKSLQAHLSSLTPAELHLIFQQSGLTELQGQTKGFVKSFTTGRFPKEEVEKFCDEKESLVDDFINDRDLSLEDITDVPVESNDTDEIGVAEAGDSPSIFASDLPEVNAKDALQALDAVTARATDSDAVEFLLASAKAKLWKYAYRNEDEVISQLSDLDGSEYSQQVRQEFLQEYREAKSLRIPDGYAFSINGEIIDPNLMQRQVASRVSKLRRYGNWSGTGAGKTLSAILATRVVDASMIVVCCPNSVVGDQSHGWAQEIKRVFPDSDVVTKTFEPLWRKDSKHRYLVLNYETFQQPDSEARLRRFLNDHRVDFIVIDEIHYAKQRQEKEMSQRKRLVEQLVTEAAKTSSEVCVLGLSATPVINNLQEGKSLVELITSDDHDDLKTKASVANCMRLHQKLVTLGTRWRPAYSTQLHTETIDVDCRDYVEEIRELGKSCSPLEYEKVLTKARIPAILQALEGGKRSLIYTHYVDEIDSMLKQAIGEAGFRVGFYTGNDKSGIDAFKRGALDVLIGSSSIGTGVDGLQHCCNQLIINALPWTNAEYEQLVGRLWRQGQTQSDVRVVIPVTYADIHGERWSYCQTKLDRISYKKTIGDAAVDGVVPEGNLRSPAQASKDLMKWLHRLMDGASAG